MPEALGRMNLQELRKHWIATTYQLDARPAEPERTALADELARIAARALSMAEEDMVPRADMVEVLADWGHDCQPSTILDDLERVLKSLPDPDETLSTIEVGDWLRKHGRAVPSYDRAGVIEALDEIDWKTGKTMGGW